MILSELLKNLDYKIYQTKGKNKEKEVFNCSVSFWRELLFSL